MIVGVSPLMILVFVMYLFIIGLSLSVNRIVNLWVVIEVGIFLFVSLSFLTIMKERLFTQGVLIYYLTQSGLSITILALLLVDINNLNLLIGIVLIVKLGVFPTNFWFYSVIIKRNLPVLFLMITFQKIPILIFLNFVNLNNLSIIILLLLNLFVCGSVALLTSDLKSLLIASSLSNNSWLIISIMSSLEVFIVFFILYVITLYLVLFSSSGLSLLSLLSLSGLPPFPLFFLKFSIIYIYFFVTSTMFIAYLGLLFILFGLVLSSSYVRFYISNLTNRLCI